MSEFLPIVYFISLFFASIIAKIIIKREINDKFDMK